MPVKIKNSPNKIRISEWKKLNKVFFPPQVNLFQIFFSTLIWNPDWLCIVAVYMAQWVKLRTFAQGGGGEDQRLSRDILKPEVLQLNFVTTVKHSFLTLICAALFIMPIDMLTGF